MAEHEKDLINPTDTVGDTGPEKSAPAGKIFTDPAAQSLADALHVSFRLLRFVMIAVVVLFLATGITSIEEQEMGVLKVFGRTVDTKTAGLVWNWPFPIGQIELIEVRERPLEINDFWMHVAPQDKFKKVSELPMPREGIVPGVDGALLTGDRGLVHLKLSCTYIVSDPITYIQSITDMDEIIHLVISSEAIIQASGRTAKSILQTAPAAFTEDIRRGAQKRLDEITGKALAVELSGIVMTDRTWPLRARPAYELAQKASQASESHVEEAKGKAREGLNKAAGASFVTLVGRPWAGDASQSDPNVDLIGQYDRARSKGDIARAEQLATMIDQTLTSSLVGGQASEIIAEATAYKTSTIEKVKSRAERFNQLLPAFEKNPQFMMDRLWASARDHILGSPTNEKFYVTIGESKFVWRITRDPNIAKQIRKAMLEAKGTQ